MPSVQIVYVMPFGVTLRRSGNAKVVRPSPPKFVPSSGLAMREQPATADSTWATAGNSASTKSY